MERSRILRWEGCVNARDLGGLRTATGGSTRWGAVIRSDHPRRLTSAGWSALSEYGVKTIIELRTYGQEERQPDLAQRPEITTIQIEIEDITDEEFKEQWAKTGLWCTPLYHQDALKRWPERHARVIEALAKAEPGGVLVHCVRGQDRTGIICLLLLSLAGVTAEEIAADYELSDSSRPEEELAFLRRSLANKSCSQVIQETLNELQIREYLLQHLSEETIERARRRLVE